MTRAKQPLFSFPGMAIAGTVIRTGNEVTRFQQGDDVFGVADGAKDNHGLFADYILVDADFLGHKPTSLTMRAAITLPLIFIAEWLIAK